MKDITIKIPVAALILAILLDLVALIFAIKSDSVSAGVLCLAVAVALGAIWHTRKLESQKAFLAFLRDYNSESRVDAAFAVIRGGKNYSVLNAEEKAAVKYLLNKFEILAIGFANGIYDRKMIKDAFGGELEGIYKELSSYIDAVRIGGSSKPPRPRSYIEFEQLVESIHNRTWLEKAWAKICAALGEK